MHQVQPRERVRHDKDSDDDPVRGTMLPLQQLKPAPRRGLSHILKIGETRFYYELAKSSTRMMKTRKMPHLMLPNLMVSQSKRMRREYTNCIRFITQSRHRY